MKVLIPRKNIHGTSYKEINCCLSCQWNVPVCGVPSNFRMRVIRFERQSKLSLFSYFICTYCLWGTWRFKELDQVARILNHRWAFSTARGQNAIGHTSGAPLLIKGRSTACALLFGSWRVALRINKWLRGAEPVRFVILRDGKQQGESHKL